jgi:hypothetical protein
VNLRKKRGMQFALQAHYAEVSGRELANLESQTTCCCCVGEKRPVFVGLLGLICWN